MMDSPKSAPKVVLIGASVRWAAQSANRAGYRVIGMDLFGDTDTRAACEHFELIDAATADDAGSLRSAIDALVRRTGSRPVVVGGLAAISQLPTPAELSAACEGLPINVPATITMDCADSFATTSPPETWLVKSPCSSGGLGVRYWDGRQSSPADWLQQRIFGRSFGVVAIANGRDTRVLGVCRSLHRRIGDLPFVYAGSVGPCLDESLPMEELCELAGRIANARAIRGLFNLDFIRDHNNGWWLLEVNARPSGSCEVIERAATRSRQLSRDESLMGMHLDAIAGQPIRWNDVPPQSVHIKRIVYAKHDGRFHRQPASIEIADVPAVGTFVQKNEPIATLLLDSAIDERALPLKLRLGVRAVGGALERCVAT